MRKRIFSSLVSMIVVITLIFTTSASVFAQNTKNDFVVYQKNSEINQQFMELQNKINDLLSVSDDKYVYDADEIKNLIQTENFDFEALNAEFGTSYTEESFTELALDAIATTNVENVYSTNGTYANRNYYTEGWNYRRYFYDEYNSGVTVDRLEQAAINWGLVGTAAGIAGAVPGIGTAIGIGIGAGAGISAWYVSTLAHSIEVNMSGVGTVTDINKFTFVFTVWDQMNFYE